jgi:hypothetical protein
MSSTNNKLLKKIDKYLDSLKALNYSKHYNNNAKDNEVLNTLRDYNNLLVKHNLDFGYLGRIASARQSYLDRMRNARIAISTKLAKESRARAEKGSKKTSAERASHRASVKARRMALRSRVKTRKLKTNLSKPLSKINESK